MPLTHTRTFRVRHYECDAYGHVNNANYLRYMQETAFDASAAAGYDLARYQAMGRQWLVRETDIEYLAPLRYGDSVDVLTWVADFQRVRSRRTYELRKAGTGELVASAHTDWVFLDSATGRPVSIPPEMAAVFAPQEGQPPRERFPQAPPPPPGVFRLQRRVQWHEIDGAQHVNNANYLTYIEDCSVQAAAAHGWPMGRIHAAGFAIVARRHRIEYRQPATLDDTLEVATWLSNVRRSTAVRHYTVTRIGDGELLARAHSLWVFLDMATGHPRRLPPTFLADFAAHIASDAE